MENTPANQPPVSVPQPPPVAPSPVTPSPVVQQKSSGNQMMMLAVVAIIVILAAGGLFLVKSMKQSGESNATPTVMQANPSQAARGPVVSVTPAVGAAGNSDTELDQQAQQIDNELSALDTDAASIDSSINDTPVPEAP